MKRERPLTHDEHKASEAAFRGLPCDPSWSQSAKAVYDGIVRAMAKKGERPIAPSSDEEAVEMHEPAPQAVEIVNESKCSEPVSTTAASDASSSTRSKHETGRTQIRSRREAIEAGVLVDVTPIAESLGLNFAVGMTKPLWEFGIEPDPEISEEERDLRIRDVLMAVRLRLAYLKEPAPFVEIPVMLTLPPEPIPQVFAIYALFHKDPVDADSLLLIHPGEVMFAKLSFSQN